MKPRVNQQPMASAHRARHVCEGGIPRSRRLKTLWRTLNRNKLLEPKPKPSTLDPEPCRLMALRRTVNPKALIPLCRLKDFWRISRCPILVMKRRWVTCTDQVELKHTRPNPSTSHVLHQSNRTEFIPARRKPSTGCDLHQSNRIETYTPSGT
jgi:hypothetical protein